jgi:hypothetical protein
MDLLDLVERLSDAADHTARLVQRVRVPRGDGRRASDIERARSRRSGERIGRAGTFVSDTFGAQSASGTPGAGGEHIVHVGYHKTAST